MSERTTLRRAGLTALLGALIIPTLLAAQTIGSPASSSSTAASATPSEDRPSMVFILMDDFSTELLATMPNAQLMKSLGASYDNAFVTDSLCCPSRAALLTGQTPQQTGVRTNTPRNADNPVGGYDAFVAHGNEAKQFSVALQGSGYTTGFVGKFMNGYEARRADGKVVPPPAVPGWTEWEAILGGGYNGWGFRSTYLDEDGAVRMRRHPKPPLTEPEEVRDAHYATNVAADKAISFIEEHRDDANPYFLEVATYGPHGQLRKAYPNSPTFPSAFADRATPGQPGSGNCGLSSCGQLGLEDLVGYDDPREDNAPSYLLPDGMTTGAPAWRTNEITLTDRGALRRYRDRARMVQSIDRMIGRVLAAVGPDTYVVLTSDNGFHLGQHQLNGGKGTPYDSDTRVPLVVVGPDVEPGTRDQFVSNVDLASTFEDLAGLRPAAYRSGRSFAPSLRSADAGGGRYAFFDHTFATIQPGEVDADRASGGTLGIVPSYLAVRSEHGLLARFDLDQSWAGTDHAWELYRYDVGWEDRNVFAEDHDEPWAQDLMRRLEEYDGCRPAQCRALTR